MSPTHPFLYRVRTLVALAAFVLALDDHRDVAQHLAVVRLGRFDLARLDDARILSGRDEFEVVAGVLDVVGFW
jgi:hypothetical protein